ncbi:MAG: hypothetical protein U0353_22335 [Sandaracinus sp.]|jgi:hypothetical protein
MPTSLRVLVPLAFVLACLAPSPVLAQEDGPTAELEVRAAIGQADAAALEGDWREASRALRGTGRTTLARAARIAVGYRVRPRVVLEMTPEQRGTVRGTDLEIDVLQTFGHIAGVIGAIGGAFSLIAVPLVAFFTHNFSDTSGIVMASTGGGGLVLAGVAIGLHVAAGERRDTLLDLFETAGATLQVGAGTLGIAF